MLDKNILFSLFFFYLSLRLIWDENKDKKKYIYDRHVNFLHLFLPIYLSKRETSDEKRGGVLTHAILAIFHLESDDNRLNGPLE